ncbi:60S ribosomal L6, mitochondrial-like [Olea europaea subsp. europaea]|uniref:60S ribosomal L6, mitochondrial-like n=1 Tax=Olea europaea subsp. europaea TaxID=158383 RepID=A0A8S0V5G3_OLEEU|nr:60S ribosomal L6, mitochondrial-like [Olea europaea subsp. europaea]
MEAKFFRFLKIVGVGFKARAEAEGRLLYLKLGYSHEVELTVPPAVRVFCFKNNVVCCTGIDKERVHQFAAAVRNCKPPEVYKGKGFPMLWIATLISLTMVAMRCFMDVPRTGRGIGRVKALACDITSICRSYARGKVYASA